MSQAQNYDEWKTLKDQIEELRQQSGPEVAIQDIFDDQVRQRFGEMITRAVIRASKVR